MHVDDNFDEPKPLGIGRSDWNANEIFLKLESVVVNSVWLEFVLIVFAVRISN